MPPLSSSASVHDLRLPAGLSLRVVGVRSTGRPFSVAGCVDLEAGSSPVGFGAPDLGCLWLLGLLVVPFGAIGGRGGGT